MTDYAHPEALVSTEWTDQNRSDTASIRILESNEDVLLYDTGHIPEAVKVDWFNELQDGLVRDYIDEKRFAELCELKGISNDTTVVFYGDKNNWWACYAFWTFKMFGHADCRIMNGGRAKWQAENRPMSTEKPSYPRGSYAVDRKNLSIRAFRDDALKHMNSSLPMVDVRSPGEFKGELLHMADYPQEGCLRGGHIPGARNVPWARAAAEDGSFRSRDELEAIYLEEQGLKPSDDVVVYCRIGERSAHTWFVLTYLLGFDKVRNYDGSWTEWGNAVGLPIERPVNEPVGASA